MKRQAITERMKVNCLLFHASLTPFPIRCGICRLGIEPLEAIEWDHIVPLALEGSHTWCNLRPLHVECHRKKTSGSKATTYGSDIHAIAKAKRISKGGKKRKGPPIKSRGFPKQHRPMQSRPFSHGKGIEG